MKVKEKEKVDRGRIEVREEECKGCGLCVDACPPRVMKLSERFNAHGYHPAVYLGRGCTGCGVCFYACPEPGALIVFTLPPPAKAMATPAVSLA
jgi:2-oxoglutarate ferredoxin oxidoreductase subunit delta